MTTSPRQAATLRDVAELAGVHPSTASRILSGARRGDPDAAQRVRQAAETLGYRANLMARALRQHNTTTIGMIVPDLENPFFPALVKSIEAALNLQGYALLLCDAQDDAAVERQRIEALLARQVDGLILCPVDIRGSVPGVDYAAGRVPVVQVDRRANVPTDFVGVDQARVMQLLIEHLHATQHRPMALLTSGDSVAPIAARTAAYRRLLTDDPQSRGRILVGRLTLQWGMQAVDELLADSAEIPAALVCANDLIALGALQRLRQAGIQVPGQVAVTGVDDTAFGRISEPELTTVRQPVEQLGEEAVTMLLSRLHDSRRGRGPRASRSLVLAPELIVRGSSAPTITAAASARGRRPPIHAAAL